MAAAELLTVKLIGDTPQQEVARTLLWKVAGDAHLGLNNKLERKMWKGAMID